MYELWTSEDGLEMWTFEHEYRFVARLRQLDSQNRKYKVNIVNC